MADITFITANKNYCLWPLPAWLCLKAADLEFDEITIPFSDPNARELFLQHTPTGSVPALKHGDLMLWDSMAICEYIAELAPEAGLWPDDRSKRAIARSFVADIHSFSGAHRAEVPSIDVGRVMPTNIRQRTNDDPVKVFKKAVENCRPLLEVKARRVGGANYQVPVEVNSNRRTSLSIRWLLSYARSRGGKGMVEKLTGEILDASSNRGGAMKKKDETHRMAEANKAFAHYRW